MTDPILTLDFAKTGRFDRRLAFARPSPAWRTAGSGLLRTVPAGQPRLESAGLLIEPATTNLLQHSSQYDQASWSKLNSMVAPDAAVAPDGSSSAWKFIENISNTAHRMNQINIVGDGVHTASIHVKAAERFGVRLRLLDSASTLFNLSADLATATPLSDSSPGSTITPVGDGWYRLSVTATLAGANNSMVIILLRPPSLQQTYMGDGASGLFIWGAQVEAGSAATSYTTTGAATLRAAESCSLPLADVPRWNAPAGTLVVEAAVPLLPAAPQTLAALSDPSGANALRLRLPGGTGVQAEAVADGAAAATLTPGLIGAGTRFRAALAWNAAGIAACLDGGAVVTGGSGPPPTGLTTLRLGCAAGGAELARGWIGRAALYPERLADAELRRLTAA